MVHASNSWAWDLGVSDSEKEEFIIHLDKDGRKYYNAYYEWCEQLADAFTALKEAGVTVIYRPFVEMTNSSSDFWVQYCNTEAEYAAFKRVWRQTYDYMVKERGLYNVIWCLAPQFDGDMKEVYDNFYPGDEYVDVIGLTLYSYGTDSRTGSLEARLKNVTNADYIFSLGKPVGFSEIGVCYYNWDIGYTFSEENKYGDFENLIVKLKEAFAGKISFCSLWASTAGPFNPQNRNPEKFIQDEFFIGLDELMNS